MREEVIARHIASHEERPATIDDETSVLTDNDGNKLDFRFWTYRRIDEPSQGFFLSMAIVGLVLFIGVLALFNGGE